MPRPAREPPSGREAARSPPRRGRPAARRRSPAACRRQRHKGWRAAWPPPGPRWRAAWRRAARPARSPPHRPGLPGSAPDRAMAGATPIMSRLADKRRHHRLERQPPRFGECRIDGQRTCPDQPDRAAEGDCAGGNAGEEGDDGGGNAAPISARQQRDRHEHAELRLHGEQPEHNARQHRAACAASVARRSARRRPESRFDHRKWRWWCSARRAVRPPRRAANPRQRWRRHRRPTSSPSRWQGQYHRAAAPADRPAEQMLGGYRKR